MVGGSAPADPSALMQSARMRSDAGRARKDHDLVIIDTPPIAHVADAISLLRHVDGVLLAASVSSTRGPEARRLKRPAPGPGRPTSSGVVANGGSAMNGYAYARPTARARPAARRGRPTSAPPR